MTIYALISRELTTDGEYEYILWGIFDTQQAAQSLADCEHGEPLRWGGGTRCVAEAHPHPRQSWRSWYVAGYDLNTSDLWYLCD